MTTADKAQGIVLANEPSLSVFNEAIKTVGKFFFIDNWLYSLVLIACAILAFVVFRKCDKAETTIDSRQPIGAMELVLQRISIEVGKSCSNTIWGLVLAVAIMLTPTLLRASTDEKTQAIVNVLGFIPGVAIGLIQLYSAYKIIEYVLSKLLPTQPITSGSQAATDHPKG
jgi:hypothetical protein